MLKFINTVLMCVVGVIFYISIMPLTIVVGVLYAMVKVARIIISTAKEHL